MYNETITFYSKNPPNKGQIENPDIEYWEENRTCGDDLKITMNIENQKITDWKFEGETAIITTACASIFGESIIGQDIHFVFDCDLKYIESLIGMPVSSRRRQAAVLGLLTTRNGIRQYLGQSERDNFDDVIG